MQRLKKVPIEDKSLLFFHKKDIAILDFELREKGNLWVRYCHKEHPAETSEEVLIPFIAVCESLEQQYGDDFHYQVTYNRNELERLIAFRYHYWDALQIVEADLLRILKEELEYGSYTDFSQGNPQGVVIDLFHEMNRLTDVEERAANEAKMQQMSKKIMALEAKQVSFFSQLAVNNKAIQQLTLDALGMRLSDNKQNPKPSPN